MQPYIEHMPDGRVFVEITETQARNYRASGQPIHVAPDGNNPVNDPRGKTFAVPACFETLLHYAEDNFDGRLPLFFLVLREL